MQRKLLAYYALACSASIPWPEFDIEKTIVVNDFEATVTDMMLYIKSDYTTEKGVQTVKIDHTDGSGMYLPGAKIVPEDLRGKNFMYRGSWFKGLLTQFDYLKFCEVNNANPIVKDFWGNEHDLIKEDIQMIFFDSQFKLAKLYKDYDEYKYYFHKTNAHFCIAQFEEDDLPDKNFNYQMIQTLQDITDEEIDRLISKTHNKLANLAKNKDTMLKTLKANVDSPMSDKVALSLYPALLRDGYSRAQLKDVKKRTLYDAKSGAIKCFNKRLYVIPDMYAACERLFLGIEQPEGLLKKDEVACRPFLRCDEVDVLRSPHLYLEHAIAKVNKDPSVYEWLTTNGIYTSVKSLISRILQFDVDGDQLNVVAEKVIIDVAKRNIKEYDIVPLFYDAAKAPPEQVSKEAQFNGLKRAHQFSNIGEISNMLTRLWNRDNPDREVAALLTALNNWRID